MNVLKKDIFAKPGAKSKQKRNDISNFTSVNYTARSATHPLPFLPHHVCEEEASELSQQSTSSALAQYPVSNPHADIFKKPRPVLAGNSGGRIQDCDSTNDVLKVLGESSSVSKQCDVSNLTFRPPQNEGDDVLTDSQPTSQYYRGPNTPLEPLAYTPASGRVSPPSSIRAHNTATSSDKKTPRLPNSRLQKTPKTSSTTTGGPSDSDISCCIIAVTEGRGHASGEVGIAAMDPRLPHLVLCQISDSQRYSHSLAKMNVFNFTEAIVPNTFVEGPTPRKLYLDLLERFPSVTVNHVQRRHFSEAAGLQMIQQYCSRESESVMVVVKDKFYALAAAAALLKYIEFTQGVLIASRSLKIEYQGTDGTAIIDLDTANRLELVMGLVTREETHSLLGVLKQCRTRGGLRLLRSNLLQPPTEAAKINARLDCVTELIENPILFNSLEAVMSQLKNADSLLSLCMHPPQQTGLKAAQYQLKYTLLLKTTLELVPILSAALDGASAEYFNNVRENLGDGRLVSVLKRVLQTFVEKTPGGRPGSFNPLHACFMIRPGINGLLDVAKKTYCELAQEIADMVIALKEKLNLPLRLAHSQSKGYHIQMSPLDRIPIDDLPPELILVHKSRNSLTCHTMELVALDQRCQQALHEIELMTNVLLFELLNDVRDEISCLFPLCECLSELDVCIAFAHVGAVEGYVRPTFSTELRIREARHPVLDVTNKERVVANHVFANVEENFVILTGPNQSGKSIYIRQIALLQVMAQVGSYVPAREASFRIADRIFSRIGFDDSIESNASTLMVEMQDMEFIRNNLTETSLVIVDELCRGTSVDEGTCLAFVFCEELLDTSAFVFFTTHFFFLTKLQEMYCNVRNFHFETHLAAEGRPVLLYTHRMLEGVTPAEQYGIRLAELMGCPPSVLTVAREVAEQFLAERKPQPDVCGLNSCYEISVNLRNNLPQGDATWDQILPVIRHYKEQYELLPPEDLNMMMLLRGKPTLQDMQNQYNVSAISSGEDSLVMSNEKREEREVTEQVEEMGEHKNKQLRVVSSPVNRRIENQVMPVADCRNDSCEKILRSPKTRKSQSQVCGEDVDSGTQIISEVEGQQCQLQAGVAVPSSTMRRSERPQSRRLLEQELSTADRQKRRKLIRNGEDLMRKCISTSPRRTIQCKQGDKIAQPDVAQLCEKFQKQPCFSGETDVRCSNSEPQSCHDRSILTQNESLIDYNPSDPSELPLGGKDIGCEGDELSQTSKQQQDNFEVSAVREGVASHDDEEKCSEEVEDVTKSDSPLAPLVKDEECSYISNYTQKNESNISSSQVEGNFNFESEPELRRLNEYSRLRFREENLQKASTVQRVSRELDDVIAHRSALHVTMERTKNVDLRRRVVSVSSNDSTESANISVTRAPVSGESSYIELGGTSEPLSQKMEENSERTLEAAHLLLNLRMSVVSAPVSEIGTSCDGNEMSMKERKRRETSKDDEKKRKRDEKKVRSDKGKKIKEALEAERAKKKLKKEEVAAAKVKPGVDEFIRGMSAGLPTGSDKADYYEWKFSRDKKALRTVATASRKSMVSPISPGTLGSWTETMLRSQTHIATTVLSNEMLPIPQTQAVNPLQFPFGKTVFITPVSTLRPLTTDAPVARRESPQAATTVAIQETHKAGASVAARETPKAATSRVMTSSPEDSPLTTPLASQQLFGCLENNGSSGSRDPRSIGRPNSTTKE